MQTFFAAYLDQLQELHDAFARACDGLPQEALDWVPGPEMNALTVLGVHMAGSERYWIGDVVGQDPSARDRAAEFAARGLDASGLRQRLDAALAHAHGVLDKLTVEDLAAVRVSSRNGRQFTVAQALLHALEHAALHVGHAQITRQLWEQRP